MSWPSPSTDEPSSGGATLRVGCPVWACDHWKGELYTRKAKRADFLPQYSRTFALVEGNSTFYALPSPDTVRKWATSTEPGFRFCLKLPRAITHDRRLVNANVESRAFLSLVQVLAEEDRLGASFLQLPPTFSADEYPALRDYLRKWPREFPLAVEARHPDWFDGRDRENAFDSLLSHHGMDRVLLDSRALFANPPTTEHETVSQTRKPRVPLRTTVISGRPLVRFIGRDDIDQAQPWIDEWAEVVAGWLDRGIEPEFFCHAPNDQFAPAFCRRFVDAVRQLRPSVPPIGPFPGEEEPAPVEQLDLFG